MMLLRSTNGKTEKRPAIMGRVLERRQHRRHDLEAQTLDVEAWDGHKDGAKLGQILDLSSGGIRIRTDKANLKPDQQVRLHVRLPDYAGISPFVDTSGPGLRPSSEWTGWLAVTRVNRIADGQYDVAGRLMDMEDLNRGMLRLYLSTQPLAA